MGKFSDISWPADFSELKRMEELLVCGICYDYMETSVMTPCSHNYCSLCIRKYLHYKTQCPACFEKTFEKDLHTNRILDEIIVYFSKIREKLVNCISGAKITANSVEAEMNVILKSPPVRPARTIHQKTPTKSEAIIENAETVINTSFNNDKPQSSNFITDNMMSSPSTSGIPRIAKFFTPKSRKVPEAQSTPSKQVACPVCSVEISEIHINKHLDACLKRETMPDQQPRTSNKRRPLPKLVTKLMKDSELKKKLKEYNLAINGDRKTLENRFHKYVTLYNSECDKEEPRNPIELAKQLEDEENLEKKIQQKSINIGKLKVTRYAEQNIIESAQKNYLEDNKQSFQNLIESMKKRANTNKKSINKPALSHNDNFDNLRNDDSEKIEILSPNESLNQSNSKDDSEFEIFESGFQDTSDDSFCPLQRYTSGHPVNFLSVEINENAMSPQKMKPINFKLQDDSASKEKLIVEENLSIFDQTTDIDSSDNEEVNNPVLEDEKQEKVNSIEFKNDQKTDSNKEIDNICNIKEIQAKKLARSIVEDFVVDSSEEDTSEIPNGALSSLDKLEISNIIEENNEKQSESIAASRPVRKRNFPSRFSNFEPSKSDKAAQPTRLNIKSIESLQKEIDENQAAGLNENDDNSLKRRRRRKCVTPTEENKNPPRRPIRRRDLSTVLQNTQN